MSVTHTPLSSATQIGSQDGDCPQSDLKKSTHRQHRQSETLADFVAAVTEEWPTASFNPHKWSKARRNFQMSMPTVFAFVCTFGSSVVTPGVPLIASEFDVSTVAAELVLSLYVLGLAFGPILAAPLSENLGRRLVYIGTFICSCLLNLGTGFTNTFYGLLICRFLAGFFSGPALALGAATIADCSAPTERAVALTFYTGSAFFGPLVGPLMGGYVVERMGWRWSLWLVLLWTALAALIILPASETHRATIIKREAKRRAREGGVDIAAEETDALQRTTSKEAMAKGYRKLSDLVMRTVGRPIRMLFTEPILFCFSLYIAFAFGVFYGFFGAFPLVFQGVYGFSLGNSGLAWIGLLFGLLVGLGVIVACDRYIYMPKYRRVKELAVAEGRDPATAQVEPEVRLYPAIISCVTMPIALFWFGWTARPDVLWISPIVASGFFAVGNFSLFVSGVLYLTDTYGPALGASAMAANGMARYLTGASFPLFTHQMYTKLGIGWASTLFGFIALALCAVPVVLFIYGRRIREWSGRAEFGG